MMSMKCCSNSSPDHSSGSHEVEEPHFGAHSVETQHVVAHLLVVDDAIREIELVDEFRLERRDFCDETRIGV